MHPQAVLVQHNLRAWALPFAFTGGNPGIFQYGGAPLLLNVFFPFTDPVNLSGNLIFPSPYGPPRDRTVACASALYVGALTGLLTAQ